MKQKSVLTILLLVSCSLSAQPKYEFDLFDRTWKFYCGIANDFEINVADLKGKRAGWTFRVQGDGADFEYGEGGRMKILPRAEKFDLKVFAELSGELFFVGETPCRCVPPPPDENGDFKLAFPNPQTSLPNAKPFLTDGKLIKQDPDLILDLVYGMFATSIRPGVPTPMAIKVLTRDGDTYTRYWEKIEIDSPDANIVNEGKIFFTITPKTGIKRLELTVKIDGKEIGRKTFRVTAEP